VRRLPVQRLKQAAKWALPTPWWDGLRRLKPRSPDLVSPQAMKHLRRMKVRGLNPRVVLDVGAAHGKWTKACQRIFPDAHFMLLEPLPDYEAELSALVRRGRIEYIPAAAGRAEDTLSLLVPDEPQGSSFLAATGERDSYFKRSVTVPVLPLSSLDIPSGPTVLKLDVQGYELEVIAGAASILDQVEVIIAECSLYPFQQGIPLIHEVVDRVVELGYRIYDTADEVRWPSGTLAQLDLVFVSGNNQLLDPGQWD
jgi:FkbM family methyltransferase